jgi:hypothetical protein
VRSLPQTDKTLTETIKPVGFDGDVLLVAAQFWYDSYGNVWRPNGDGTTESNILRDTFQGLRHRSDFMANTRGYQGVHPIYQMFSQTHTDVRVPA